MQNAFNRYNPDFDKKMASADNAYELKLPADKMEVFQANKYTILNESVQLLLSGATVAAKESKIKSFEGYIRWAISEKVAYPSISVSRKADPCSNYPAQHPPDRRRFQQALFIFILQDHCKR